MIKKKRYEVEIHSCSMKRKTVGKYAWLYPCPFCGSDDLRVIMDEMVNEKRFQGDICCYGCFCTMIDDWDSTDRDDESSKVKRRETIRMWNRRTNENRG